MPSRIITAFATLAGFLSFASPVLAADVTGSTTGIFVNPQPGGTFNTGVGTSHFTSGSGVPNVFGFSGATISSAFETPFKVGSLSYFNGATNSGTAAQTFDIALTLNFLTPTIPAVTSNFTFNNVSTPNTSADPNANADFLYFPSAFSTTSFLIAGTTYNVALTGFQNVVGDGFLTSDSTVLHVREGSSASADLYAVVTTQTAVPEPAAWAIMAAGLGLVGGAMRRRKASVLRFA